MVNLGQREVDWEAKKGETRARAHDVAPDFLIRRTAWITLIIIDGLAWDAASTGTYRVQGCEGYPLCP